MVEVGGEYFTALSSSCRSASRSSVAIGVHRHVFGRFDGDAVALQPALKFPTVVADNIGDRLPRPDDGKVT